ncbi:MAG TPA: diaminopimelate decarboxylase [Chromatiales bacterium]|nr:diaminopimelate decarboxylase [Chromatiales bacterium]
MDYFNYRHGQLYAEDVSIADIGNDYGTPCYVYSRATIERHWHAFDDALGDHPHLICYAVKANSNLAVLNLMARMGSGFDIVSVGELERVLRVGGDPQKIVFSGVGKRVDEMQRALEVGIRCFNVESRAELERLNEVASAMGKVAPISIRVNPDVDAKTHPYISTGLKENKFGIDINKVTSVYLRAAELPHINPVGIDCHIGSQLTEVSPFLDALERVLQLSEKLEQQGISIEHLDLGGGLGIRYEAEDPPLPSDYAAAILERLSASRYEILLEPGRAIMGNAGVLLMRVEYLKQNGERQFAIVDAAMNDNMRPALYNAWQAIIPVEEDSAGEAGIYDIVGPVCETGDFLGKGRKLSLKPGDLLAMRSSGAYGFSMSSNYNTRPRPAEVMVDGDQVHLIRRRETLEDLMAGETMLPERA